MTQRLDRWIEVEMQKVVVRMTATFKRRNRKRSPEHINEFKNSYGRIVGWTQWPNADTPGPEVEVMWEEGLKYLYFLSDLEVVPVSKVKVRPYMRGERKLDRLKFMATVTGMESVLPHQTYEGGMAGDQGGITGPTPRRSKRKRK